MEKMWKKQEYILSRHKAKFIAEIPSNDCQHDWATNHVTCHSGHLKINGCVITTFRGGSTDAFVFNPLNGKIYKIEKLTSVSAEYVKIYLVPPINFKWGVIFTALTGAIQPSWKNTHVIYDLIEKMEKMMRRDWGGAIFTPYEFGERCIPTSDWDSWMEKASPKERRMALNIIEKNKIYFFQDLEDAVFYASSRYNITGEDINVLRGVCLNLAKFGFIHI